MALMRPDPTFEEYHQRMADAYDTSNYDKGLAARFLRHSHQVLESRFKPTDHFSQVLEVGAGTGVHIGFVRHRFDRYVMTDASEQMLEKADGRLPPNVDASKVEYKTEDASKLSFADDSFDRLIATHVLEHLYFPHEVLREWVRVVRPGGTVSLVLPCDPGALWRFGRMFGPRAAGERAGIAYDYWQSREHVNPITNLVTFIHYYFKEVRETWSPFRIPLPDINLFYVCDFRV